MKELSKIPALVTVGAGAAGVWKLRKDRVLGDDGGNDGDPNDHTTEQ